MKSNFSSLLALIAISFNCYAIGLDLSAVKEEACLQPEVSTDLNLTWAASVDVWYSPLWSKTELYEISKYILTPEEFESMTEEELIKTSCIYFNLKGVPVPTVGFGNKTYDYEVHFNPIRSGVADWTSRPDANGNRKWLGTGFVIMTDNKNAILGVTYWNDGTKGFSITSVDKVVPEEFLTKSKAYVEKLGFNPKFFVETPYDKCPPPPALDEMKW